MGSRQPEEAEVLDLTRFSTEFNGETDRGAALVAASRLDEVLKGILLTYLRDTKSASDLLDGFNAPLGTFAARAAACHAMGLIDDTEFSDISRIRKIRNTFGHHWKDVDFDCPEVADVARGLPWRGPTEYEATATVRSRFSAAVMLLLTDLLWRERLARKEKLKARVWPNTTNSRGPHGPSSRLFSRDPADPGQIDPAVPARGPAIVTLAASERGGEELAARPIKP